jgi:autotransporter-associated beta strand protein
MKDTPAGSFLIANSTVVARSLLLAILTATFPANSQAQSLIPTPAWQNTAVGSTIDRDMAFNPTTGNLLLVQNTPALVRIKSSDGTSAGANMDVTGLNVGTFKLSGIAVQSDGTIYGCNYVGGAQSTTPLNVYMWANESSTSPPIIAHLDTLPGASADRFGQALTVFTTATTTNLLIAGNTTIAYLLINSGGTWTFKQLTVDSQVMVPGATFVDYNASGFANKFRVIAKSRGAGGQLYNFDPTAASPITMSKTSMGFPFSFFANGVTSHGYDPVTKLLAGTTSTIQAAPFGYTNFLCSAASSVSAPTLLSTISRTATGADGGQACATLFGTDGKLYSCVSAAGGGISAYDITVFTVSAPQNTVGVVGDASASLKGVFGGSGKTYTWTNSAGTVLTDSSKYSGTGTASLTISNLTVADTDNYTVVVTGAGGSVVTATARLTVLLSPPGPKTWNGGGADDNWGTAGNWGGTALNSAGDTAFFDGATRLSPVMDSSYDVAALTFNSGASPFSISASGGSKLTLSGNFTNASATGPQTLTLPIILGANRTFSDSGSGSVINGIISGPYGITKIGSGELDLGGSSANTFSGGLTVSAGIVGLQKSSGNAVSNAIAVAGGAELDVNSSNQIDDTSAIDLQTGNGVLRLRTGVTETILGFKPSTVSNVQTNSGSVILGAGAQLTIIPSAQAGSSYSTVSIVADQVSSIPGTKFIVDSSAANAELRWTPTNIVNTFEKLVIQNGGVLRCGHGGNGWLPQDTMLGAVPVSFMQDQITINNGKLGLNSSIATAGLPLTPANTVSINQNRGVTISSSATIETFQNVSLPGKITGSGTLIHVGGADLNLGGLNDYSGGTQIGLGSLTVNNASAMGSGSVKFTSGLGVLAVSSPGLIIPNHIDLSAIVTNGFGTYVNSTNFTLSGDVDLGNTGFSPQLFLTNPASVVTFTGTLTNSLGLVKSGAGEVILTGNNTYGGPTEVMLGALIINNTTGSGTSSGTVTVDAGGTLGGNGTIAGTVDVSGTVSPGSSVGQLHTADQTWNGGGHYKWEMNDATGTAGTSPGWDKLAITGGLNITANSGNPFNIDITSLAGAVAGNAANFNNAIPQSWTILTATAGITGFDATAFNLTTSGFSNPLGGAHFEITNSLDGKDLIVRLVTGAVGTGTGLIGDYYNSGTGASPTSFPDPAALERLDSTVDFNWGNGSPDPVINTNHFVVRWTGQVQPFTTETYTFYTTTDDGVRLWVNGQLLIDKWIDQAPTDWSGSIALTANQKYGIVMEYYENAVGALAKLSWAFSGRSKEIIPQTQLYPVSVPAQPAFSRSGDQITLTWVGTFSLESATDLHGPWTPSGQSSPYTFTIDPGTPQIFFRIVSQ